MKLTLPRMKNYHKRNGYHKIWNKYELKMKTEASNLPVQ